MDPIDLKARFGDRYKIAHDEAADHEAGGRHNPWLYQIPCRCGHIYPYSDNLLAVYCDRRGVLPRFREIEGLIAHQIGDEEAVYLFETGLFEAVAAVVHPKRRRRMSAEAKAALIERGRSHQFTAKTTAYSASKRSQNRVSRSTATQRAA